MADATNLTQFDQFKEMLKQLPADILKINECLAGQHLDQITEYGNPAIETAISDHLKYLFKSDAFTIFGERVEQLQKMKEAVADNTDSLRRLEPATLNIVDSKNCQLIRHNKTLKKYIRKNNTEINLLMDEVEKKRNHIRNVQSQLQNL